MSTSGSKAPRAVILSAHPWHGTPYGLHHVARTLVQLGWQVLYVEPHFSFFHVLAGRRRGRVFGHSLRPSCVEGIWLISPFVGLPHANAPILRSELTLSLASLLSWPRLPQRLSKSTFANPDLVISGDPGAMRWAVSLGARVTAYRLADDARLFDVVTPAIRKREAEGLQRFDIVLATSTQLVDKATRGGARRVHLLTNGVDRSLFERPAAEPDDIARLPRPRVLYVGAIENWFDWETVIDAAWKRPAYAFAIIGSVSVQPTGPVPGNITLLGMRPYEQMPAYMQAADVGIIPFAAPGLDEAVSSINPLKLYEYLAAGLPVVSSIEPPQLKSSDALVLYHSREEFLAGLDHAVALHKKATITAPDWIDWLNIVAGLLEELSLP